MSLSVVIDERVFYYKNSAYIYIATMPTFSPQLILRAQRIFKKRSGRIVNEEEAEIFLERLAQFGLIALGALETENTKKYETHHPH